MRVGAKHKGEYEEVILNGHDASFQRNRANLNKSIQIVKEISSNH